MLQLSTIHLLQGYHHPLADSGQVLSSSAAASLVSTAEQCFPPALAR